MPYIPSSRQYSVVTATRRSRGGSEVRGRYDDSPLLFEPLTLDAVPRIRPFLELAKARTCDFSIGGLLMWSEYFNYTYSIYKDTLYIKGVTEDDVTRPAFSLPVGASSLSESLDVLKDYCRSHGCMPLVFSAVPEMYVEQLRSLGAADISMLDDWGDYLYEAQSLATLSGKKLGKKRNHVNRFMLDNPDYLFEPMTSAMVSDVREFYSQIHLPLSKPVLADIEREQVMCVLDNLDRYGFEGAVLSVPGHGIVAFTLGEVIGDTLYTHIEKIDHLVAGAGETVNKLFAEMMIARHPDLRYINREEDVGDPGLRRAKESYHPVAVLSKYNVEMG
ncbi:phosphatidylglycerol lysyltransferase domain-containing protein [uncultured Duncaniella sp.]|uniref:DUF2156 domain-containing protein n=1 Tax=uncultured Duncaniella sp. TaxID=2768039 RepID=UPI0025A9F3D9|nr:phosphatidylglycerol lysyltransferase domain-containing protein [uncultured Duncaniella sp.]